MGKLHFFERACFPSESRGLRANSDDEEKGALEEAEASLENDGLGVERAGGAGVAVRALGVARGDAVWVDDVECWGFRECGVRRGESSREEERRADEGDDEIDVSESSGLKRLVGGGRWVGCACSVRCSEVVRSSSSSSVS